MLLLLPDAKLLAPSAWDILVNCLDNLPSPVAPPGPPRLVVHLPQVMPSWDPLHLLPCAVKPQMANAFGVIHLIREELATHFPHHRGYFTWSPTASDVLLGVRQLADLWIPKEKCHILPRLFSPLLHPNPKDAAGMIIPQLCTPSAGGGEEWIARCQSSTSDFLLEVLSLVIVKRKTKAREMELKLNLLTVCSPMKDTWSMQSVTLFKEVMAALVP